MTTIQNIQTPTIQVNTNVIRKLALAGGAVIVGAALLVFLASNIDFAELFTTVVDWSASMYFIVLAAAVACISALGIRENVLESRKTQFDIR